MKQNNHQKQIRIYGISAVLFATITVVVYLLMPLFSLPVSELECGYDWIVFMWQTGIVANITSFLLPIIGLVGVAISLWGPWKKQNALQFNTPYQIPETPATPTATESKPSDTTSDSSDSATDSKASDTASESSDTASESKAGDTTSESTETADSKTSNAEA